MSTYAIGDIHGCYDEFNRLLDQLRFDPAADTLWLTGDLISRGADSLSTLRLIYQLRDCVVAVLGNHDVHLLATASGHKQMEPTNSALDILHAKDSDTLLQWLYELPFAHYDAELGFLMTHAGVHPHWDLPTTLNHAQALRDYLDEPGSESNRMHRLYGNVDWEDPDGDALSHLKFAINCFTRMRYCRFDGSLNFSEKKPVGEQPSWLYPWFSLPSRKPLGTTVIHGHWAALGFYAGEEVLALDTGCVWQGELTAISLDEEQQTRYRQSAIKPLPQKKAG